VDDTFNFTAYATDAESGIGSVMLCLSYDNFATVANYSLTSSGGDVYSTLVDHLPPGVASYYFVATDSAGNSVTIQPAGGGYFTLTIDPLTIHYVIVMLGVLAAGVALIVICVGTWHKWAAWKRESSILDRARELESSLQPRTSEQYDFA
jgi:hypothetical protein